MPERKPPGPAAVANPAKPGVPDQISSPKLLLGEGVDEVFFFSALCRSLNLVDIQIEEYGGKTNLKSFLETLVVRPGFRTLASLGITRDGDTNPSGAFQSVAGALQTSGLPRPIRPGKSVVGPPRTSVLVLPGSGNKGMLEDLCLQAVVQDNALVCVDEFFQCVKKRGRRTPRNMAKARVHAWLASQEESDLRLGEAAQKGYWPWDSPAFAELKAFILAAC